MCQPYGIFEYKQKVIYMGLFSRDQRLWSERVSDVLVHGRQSFWEPSQNQFLKQIFKIIEDGRGHDVHHLVRVFENSLLNVECSEKIKQELLQLLDKSLQVKFTPISWGNGKPNKPELSFVESLYNIAIQKPEFREWAKPRLESWRIFGANPARYLDVQEMNEKSRLSETTDANRDDLILNFSKHIEGEGERVHPGEEDIYGIKKSAKKYHWEAEVSSWLGGGYLPKIVLTPPPVMDLPIQLALLRHWMSRVVTTKNDFKNPEFLGLASTVEGRSGIQQRALDARNRFYLLLRAVGTNVELKSEFDRFFQSHEVMSPNDLDQVMRDHSVQRDGQADFGFTPSVSGR